MKKKDTLRVDSDCYISTENFDSYMKVLEELIANGIPFGDALTTELADEIYEALVVISMMNKKTEPVTVFLNCKEAYFTVGVKSNKNRHDVECSSVTEMMNKLKEYKQTFGGY